MKKILITFFSATGTTAKLAQRFAEEINADLYEIKPEKPYTEKDLNWVNPISRTTKEYIRKSNVPIAGKINNLNEYDTIIIGFPIWFFKEPNIIKSFLSQYDLSGKTVSCFATSHKAGIVKAESELKALCPNAIWKSGILANGKSSDELRKWLTEITQA